MALGKAGFWLRLAVGLALFIAVATAIDLGRSLDSIAHADLGWLAAALSLMLLDRAAMAFKWLVLLRARGIALPFARAFKLYLVGTLVSSVLPSSLGGDAWRGLAAAGSEGERPSAVASVFVERALGFVATVLVSLGASALAVRVGFGAVAYGVMAASGLMLVAFAVFVLLASRAVVLNWLSARADSGLLRPLRDIAVAVASYRDSPWTLWSFLVLSVVEQILSITVILFLARAVGAVVPALALFACVPMSFIAESLPVSLGGLGVRELAYVTLLRPFGMAPDAAFAVSLLVQLGTIVLCLPGALFVLVNPRELSHRRAPEKPQER